MPIKSRKTRCLDSAEGLRKRCLRRLRRVQGAHSEREGQKLFLEFCYRLSERCADSRHFEKIRTLTSEKSRPRGKLARLPSAWVLSLMCQLQGEITRPVRNKIRLHAFALDHAIKHHVPKRFLIGFIYQEGGFRKIERHYVSAIQ